MKANEFQFLKIKNISKQFTHVISLKKLQKSICQTLIDLIMYKLHVITEFALS